MVIFGWYLVGCIVYGVFVSTMGLMDEEISDETFKKGLLLTPLWPVVLYLTIKNLWRMKK